jgi:hypothetical protein
MSGYLDHLVDRTLGVTATLQPRPRSQFEPAPVGDLDVESTPGWTEPSTADPMERAPARGMAPERTVSPPLATPQERWARPPGAAQATRQPQVTPDRPGASDGDGRPNTAHGATPRRDGPA